MKRKKRIEPSLEERIERDPTLRLLRERILYHEERLREERAARGEDTSNDRSFLSFSREEQHEVALQKLRECIARRQDTASAGQ